MAVVYQHRRLDNNEIFYIGIGKNKNRAFSKRNRSIYWNNLTNKYGYIVEILFENILWEEACLKEIDLIKFYGRKDLGDGILINLTKGGEGCFERNLSQETKNKISLKHLGKKLSEFTKKSISLGLYKYKDKHHMKKEEYRTLFKIMKSKKISQYDLDGVFIRDWNNILEASSSLKIDNSSIGKCCNKKLKSAGKYIWKYREDKRLIEPISKRNRKKGLKYKKLNVLLED